MKMNKINYSCKYKPCSSTGLAMNMAYMFDWDKANWKKNNDVKTTEEQVENIDKKSDTVPEVKMPDCAGNENGQCIKTSKEITESEDTGVDLNSRHGLSPINALDEIYSKLI